MGGNIRTSLEGYGRAREINRHDRELGGFLSMFAKLPPGNQKDILAQVNKLRQEHKARIDGLNGTEKEKEFETFMAEIKALAEMYGVIVRGGYGKEKPATLTFRLDELAEDMRDTLNQATLPPENNRNSPETPEMVN